MPSTDRVEVSLESNLQSVDQAEEMAREFAREAGFGEEDEHRIALAVREAMVNAVIHGNKYDPCKRALVRLELENHKLVVVVTDQGLGFDVASVPDPLAEENLLKQTGRGIFLIRSFMDEVQITRLSPTGTEVRMIKYPSVMDGKEESL